VIVLVPDTLQRAYHWLRNHDRTPHDADVLIAMRVEQVKGWRFTEEDRIVDLGGPYEVWCEIRVRTT
jgi:hypothetical protein